MNLAVVVYAILVGLTIAPATAAAQALGLYDDFSSSTFLNPGRWRGTDTFVNNTLGVRDTGIARRITPGATGTRRFQASLRTFGATGLNAGVSGTARNRIHIDHPNLTDQDPPLTVIQTKITPIAAVAENCALNTSETRARAHVLGFLFNDGTSNATETDLNGDILAGVNLERNSKLGDRIVAFIARCDQAQCGDAQTLKVVIFAHRWAVNRPELVTVRWRKATKDFQFVVGTETRVLTYGDILPFDRELPKNFFFPIGIQNTVANCGSERLEAFFDAHFDDVRINATATAVLGP
jgi:hypothetical protein